LEPVRVVCPSCQGKLVVRLESLLGQLVVCPRCKSNVQIPASPVAPSPTVPSIVTPTTYDSSAITRVDDGELAKRLADEQEKAGGLFDLDGQSFENAIDSFRPAHGELTDSRSNSSKSIEPIIEETAPLEPLSRDEAIVPARMTDWSPPETKRRQQILMIAMAGVATTLLAIVGLVAFLKFQSSPAPVVQLPSDNTEPAQPPPLPVEKDAPNVPKQDTTDKKDGEITGLAEPPIATPPEPPVTKIDKVLDSTKSKSEPNGFEKMLPDQTAVIGNSSVSKPAGSKEPDVPSSSEIPAAMLGLRQIFDVGSLKLMPDAIANDAPSPGAELGAEKVDIETLYHPSPVTPSPLAAIEAKPIARLTTKESVPLNSILLMFGQLSGGGFGWDIEAVRMAGFNVDTPISLAVEATSIGQVVKDLCHEKNLTQSIDPQGLPRLRPVPNEIVSRLPNDWSLDDLITQPSSRDAWQALLKQLYPSWSDEWQLQDTKLQWSETASPLHQATMAGFLDQVRIVNGLTPKSTLPESVRDPRLGLDASQVPLSRVGSRLIEHPMSLPQLLDIAARDSGLKLLLDWESLFSHGFAHSRVATSLLRGRTWPEIAKWGMDEFSLVAVVDGADHIVLTTLPKQRRIWRTLVMKLDAGKTVGSIRDSFRMLSPTDESGRSMLLVSPIPLPGDSSESWVVVRICPPNTVQLQIRGLREALRLPALVKKEL
jgi:hypothetical protein